MEHIILTRTVQQPTQSRGHILDWMTHRQSEDLQSASVTVSPADVRPQLHQVQSTFFKVSEEPPVYKSTRNLKAIDRQAFKEEIENFISKSPQADERNEFLASSLDKHGPVSRRIVRAPRPPAPPLPWFSSVAQRLLDLKLQGFFPELRGDGSNLAYSRQTNPLHIETGYQARATGKDR